MTTEAKWSDFTSLDTAKMLTAANRLLPAWVTLLLVVLIAWQLAKIFWSLVPGPSAGDTVPAPTGSPAALSASNDSADVSAIANAHLFGVASTDPVDETLVVVEETENLRDTRITSLSLRGTIASDIEANAVAIIADSGNEEKVYLIGDAVTSGAKLHAVYADRVVLNENGVYTNLKLPKDFPANSSPVARRNMTSTRRAVSTNNTQSIQAVVTQNVSKLADVIRPTPYFVNGQQQGYRVYPGRNRAQFTALGLRPGDLIKDIDGQALTDPSQAMQVFQSLGSADQVSVTVERNGQPETIVLRTSQLDLGDETNQ
jgi:general secretion pathway protein C